MCRIIDIFLEVRDIMGHATANYCMVQLLTL